MDDNAITAGVLLEAAQNNQKVVEASVVKLDALIRRLQDLPREVTPEVKASIEATLRAELAAARHEFHVLATSLRHARERMARTLVLIGSGVVAASMLAVGGVLLYLLPSPKDIQTLRAEKETLQETVTALEEKGGRATVRKCGNPGEKERLCALVDPAAGTFGTATQRYMVLKEQ